jgi:nucleotide-binding universal stress UspA family protein
VVASYGVGARREIVRTRPGRLGEDVARLAAKRRAELVVVGAPIESRRGFRRAFPREVLTLVRDAPCRVMVATASARSIRAWPAGVARRMS